MTFYGERVRFAFEMRVSLEDNSVGMPEVGAKRDVIAMRKLRIQTAGRFGSTIAQRPSADLLGSTINSPPQPAGFFFFSNEGVQFIRFHPLDLGGGHGGQSLALNRLEHPIHDRVVADAHEPFRSPQANAFQIMLQGRSLGFCINAPEIPFPACFSATATQPTLVAMAAFSVFNEPVARTM
jgi:hypothetical protein